MDMIPFRFYGLAGEERNQLMHYFTSRRLGMTPSRGLTVGIEIVQQAAFDAERL